MFDGSQVKKLVALAEVWCMAVRRHGGVVSGLLFVFLVSWRRMIVPFHPSVPPYVVRLRSRPFLSASLH